MGSIASPLLFKISVSGSRNFIVYPKLLLKKWLIVTLYDFSKISCLKLLYLISEPVTGITVPFGICGTVLRRQCGQFICIPTRLYSVRISLLQLGHFVLIFAVIFYNEELTGRAAHSDTGQIAKTVDNKRRLELLRPSPVPVQRPCSA